MAVNKGKAFLGIALAIMAGWYALGQTRAPRTNPDAGNASPASVPLPREGAWHDDGSLARAIATHGHEVPVTGRGSVVRLLADDRDGSPHQRILLRVAGGGTVLIAHNIALAPRLEPLAAGDEVEFAGDYVWNEKGGVVHWTHPDPQGGHRAGWIRRADGR